MLPQGREWFYDDRTETLIYKPNGTATPAGTATPTGEFVATSLKVLFNISGTKQKPAHHVAITGVTLRDTAYTYFDPHGLPSGGDWALQKHTGAAQRQNCQIVARLLQELSEVARFSSFLQLPAT